ncbi:phospholipase-like protein [Tanacetum coccineum]
MTIVEYLKYEKKVNENHINDTKSYLPTYFGKSTPTHDPIREFAHYFVPNQPGAESDCDSKDMEEEVEYITEDEVGVENMKDALIIIIKSIRQEMKDDIMKRQFEASTASVCDEVSSIASNKMDKEDDNTSNTAPCRLPKELSPGSLDKLIGTSTLENMTGTNEPLGTINILVKFEELEFPCNFVTKIDKDVIILGRPFLEPTRAQIDVFNDEISFEIGSEKIKFNIDSYQGIEKIFMVSTGQEEETFNPLEIGIDLFSYESPACLQFEQRTRSYGTPKPQDEIAGPDSLSPDRRGLGTLTQWICFRYHERRAVKGSYIGFADFLQVRYRQQKIDDTTRELRYYEWVAQNYEFSKHSTLTSTTLNDHYPYNTNDPIPTPQGHQEQGENKSQPIRPRPCNYSFEEWLKIRIGHNNLYESDREFIVNEWILDSYDEEYAREFGNPYSRRFDEYNRVFNNEIGHLSNEYILRIGKKGYVLDDV